MHLPDFDAFPVHSALRVSGIGRIKIQVRALDMSYFTRKSKCAFIKL